MNTKFHIAGATVAAVFLVSGTDPASGAEEAPSPAVVQSVDNPAADAPSQIHLTFGARLGDDVQEYLADALIPLGDSKAGRALFLNIRGSFLEDVEQEANAGLVFRQITPDGGFILGMNAFYDTRWTELDNTYDQVGGGVEVLGRRMDFRANYYYPLDDLELISETSASETTSSSTGGQRVRTTTTIDTRLYEEAMPGYDLEFGYWLPFLDRIAPTAVYAGYYDFQSDVAEDISGFKGRVESRLSSFMTFDAEWYEDDKLNQSEYFVGLRFHFSLGRGVGRDREDVSMPRLAGNVASRLYEPVYRDFRVRTRVVDRVETSINATSSTIKNSTSAPPAVVVDPPPPPPSNCVLDPFTGLCS